MTVYDNNDKGMTIEGNVLAEWLGPSVYLLVSNDEVVYVGQSMNGLARVTQHYKKKVFDKIVLLPTPAYDLTIKECELIIKYQPYYNKKLPVNDRYHVRKNICKEIGIDTWHFRRLKPNQVFLEYYDLLEVEKLLIMDKENG